MPALTHAEHAAREAAISAAYVAQPVRALADAGCCPSVTIVDYGLPTQHVVYCEKHVPVGFGHAVHKGLAGVEVPTAVFGAMNVFSTLLAR